MTEAIFQSEPFDKLAWQLLNALPLVKKDLLNVNTVVREEGIALSQIQVLAFMEEAEETTISAISKRFGIAKSNITPLVDALIELNYVQRLRSIQDRRIVNIKLCPEGKKKLAQLRKSIASQLSSWATSASEEQVSNLISAIESLAVVFKDEQLPQ